MQVKKFEAPTIQEALKVIKQEMGPDAIILSTKENKKSFGLMKKGSVEVTAAISKKDLQKKQMAEKLLPKEVKEKIWGSSASSQKQIYDSYFDRQLNSTASANISFSNTPEENAKNNPMITTRETRYIDIQDEDNAEPIAIVQQREEYIEPKPNTISVEQARLLEQEIEDLKKMMKHLSTHQNANNYGTPVVEASDELTEAFQLLVTAGVEKKYAREFIKSVEFELSTLERKNISAIQEKLAQIIFNKIKTYDILQEYESQNKSQTARVLAIIGPTGVGKTTTVAKIASLAITKQRLKIGLINLDSYKVAAVDQIATYAKLMNCPFRAVSSKRELQEAIYDFSSLDLIIIDTTGRSQKDQIGLNELKSHLSVIDHLDTLLTISATTKDFDITDILNRFKGFNPKGIIYSKLDETNVFGTILNTHLKSSLPLSFFTVGQRVPEDIEVSTRERLVDLIMKL